MQMDPTSVFDPSNALDPTAFVGEAGAARLMDAAAHFPGGPVMLVFLLFWAPVGPGIPAGILLAQHLRLPPPLTLGLYALSDVLAALLLNPVYSWLRTQGWRNPTLRKIGSRVLKIAMIGIRRPTPDDLRDGRVAPVLFRIATVGFGVDIYTAGAIASGLPIPRLPGWAAALVGDLLWFSMLLASSIAAARIFDDDRVVAAVVIAVTLVVPPLARRVFPALR